jgi:hypothetical protein
MIKNIPCFLILCFSVLAQLSCTRQLHIETMRPAKVPIAYEQWKVVVLNRINPRLIEYENEKEADVMTNAAYEAFYGAVDAILDDSTYLLVHTDTTSFPTQSPGDKLTATQVKQLYRQHPHHLLLALDHFDFFMVVESVRDEYGQDFLSSTNYINMVAQSRWTLYDSTGTVLDSVSMIADEIYQPSLDIGGFIGPGPSLTRLAPTIYKLAWYSGYDYWMRLSAQPVSYARPFYSGKNLKEAAAYMVAEDWEKAISLLKPIAQGENREAAKAAYNLAVIYEALSQFKEAKYWAMEAAQKNNRLAMLLLHELESY